MKERFKRYLETEFRAIAPTLAAMEYRQQMLKQLMDRAQELRIKGIDDEDLIYSMCIEELGDFRSTLVAFEEKEHKVENAKRKGLFIGVGVVGAVLLFVLVYLLVSFFTRAWALTWLILVGGAFAGVIAVACLLTVKFGKAKKFVAMRLMPPVVIALVCVYLFLLLQLVFKVEMSWLIFLVMVIVMLGFDTLLADATNFKFRYVELGVFMEVFCVLLYVILGLTVPDFWHPGWVLCLVGIIASIIMAIILIKKYNNAKDNKEKEKINKKYKKEDESYYTMWKD